MTTWQVALVWLLSGVAATALARLTRRPRLAALGPVVGGVGSLFAVVSPAAGPLLGAQPGLTRVGGLALLLGGIAVALTIGLGGVNDGREAFAAGLLGGVAALLQDPGSGLDWALLIGAAVAIIAVRWIAAAPSPPALGIARIGGIGVVGLCGAVVYDLGAVAQPLTPQELAVTTLVGWLLLLGLASMFGLLPLGGWAVGAMRVQRPADAALWPALLLPSLLLGCLTLPATLAANADWVLGRGLITLGLTSALWHGARALADGTEARYARVLLADIGLLAAGLGVALVTYHTFQLVTPPVVEGVVLLLGAQLMVLPLLLTPPRLQLSTPRRAAWLVISGAPLSAAFWARLLILEGCAQAGGAALPFALAATVLLALAGLRGLFGRGPVALPRSPLWLSGLAAALALAGVALSLVPSVTAHLMLGSF